MMCTCAHKFNGKRDNLPFEYMQSLTIAVKMVGKTVASKEAIRAYIKAHSNIG